MHVTRLYSLAEGFSTPRSYSSHCRYFHQQFLIFAVTHMQQFNFIYVRDVQDIFEGSWHYLFFLHVIVFSRCVKNDIFGNLILGITQTCDCTTTPSDSEVKFADPQHGLSVEYLFSLASLFASLASCHSVNWRKCERNTTARQ